MLWFWWWLLFVVLLLIPLGYGWGYRGWDPPYPSHYEPRRTTAGARSADPATDPDVVVVEDPVVEDEVAGWGLLADVLWVMAVVALVWLLVGLLL